MAFLVALSGFFVAKIPVQPELATVSSIFVMLFALPAYRVLIQWIGWQQGLRVLIILGLFAIVLESFAVYSGFPYGRFTYGEKIGAKVFGLVPWTVPFAWTPLLLTAIALAQRWVTRPHQIVIASGLTLVAIDMVLDPAAVAQQFWTWAVPGSYYQVPFSNFCGWLLSGIAGSVLFMLMTRPGVAQFESSYSSQPPVGLMKSSFLILCFWTSVCFWMQLWIPVFIGISLLLTIGYYLRREL